MTVVDVTTEVSGLDSWDNIITPYIYEIPQTIRWHPTYQIGSNILKYVNTNELQRIVTMTEPYTKEYNCDNCMDWGCTECCDSDDEIRSRQGIFS